MGQFDTSSAARPGMSVAGTPDGIKPEAFFEMGVLCASGLTRPTDRVAAHKWFSIAIKRGYPGAAAWQADVARQMLPGEIAMAERQARLWLVRH